MAWRIPLNKALIHAPSKLKSSLGAVIDSGTLTNNGPKVRELETRLAKEFDRKYALCTASGTTALELALESVPGSTKVITSPFSFIASSSAIIWKRLKPVFADIDPETWCLDPMKAEERITENTSAILPVHVFGSACDVERFQDLGKLNDLRLIYDGAHAAGIEYNSKSVLAYGDISIISLHAYKIIQAVEGGVLFTNDPETYQKVFQLRYFGKNINNDVVRPGTNAKMSEIHATFGLHSFDNYKTEIESRKSIKRFYIEHLQTSIGVSIPEFVRSADHNCSYFPLLLESETKVLNTIEKAAKNGIEFRRYFYPALQNLEFMDKSEKLPVSEDVSRRVICIPIYSSLSSTEQNDIIDCLL